MDPKNAATQARLKHGIFRSEWHDDAVTTKSLAETLHDRPFSLPKDNGGEPNGKAPSTKPQAPPPSVAACSTGSSSDDDDDFALNDKHNSQLSTSESLEETMRLRRLRVHPLNREQAWEDLDDDLFIILGGRMDHLEEFEKLHKLGIQRSNILRNLAYLVSKPCRRNESFYFENISSIACFLSIGRDSRECKLALLRTLMVCLSPPEAVWQTRDAVVEGTLEFMTQGKNEWEFLEHSEMVLIWEIRAMCLHQIQLERQRVERVANTGDSAAIMISTSAKLIETGMVYSVPVISNRIDKAGDHVKGYLKPDDYPLIMDRNAVVAMTYSNAAKRASESARQGTRLAVGSIRNISSKGFHMVAQQFDGNISESLPPEGVEVLKAVGKVGMATLGAAAIVGEAMVGTSRAVVKKTAGVTADVVRHKYGESAGQVVSDAGETAGNILRTLGHVAMLEGKVIASVTTKDAGKSHVNGEFAKAKESMRLLENQAIGMVRQSLQTAADENHPRVIAAPDGKHMHQRSETFAAEKPNVSMLVSSKMNGTGAIVSSDSNHPKRGESDESDDDDVCIPAPSMEDPPLSPGSQRTASTLQESDSCESLSCSGGNRESNQRGSAYFCRRGSRSLIKRNPLTPNAAMVSNGSHREAKPESKLSPTQGEKNINFPILTFV